jgi:ribonucleotide reductase beta subunit family protein with ferritin-like domain
MNSKYEILLDPSINKLTVFPIQFPNIWKAYKEQQAAIWNAEEIDFSKDYEDYCKLNNNEQHFIKMVLAFFAASDSIVNMNIGERFSKDVQIIEAKITYNYQQFIESVHSETYSLQIENMIRDPIEKDKLFNAIRNFPCVEKKANWALSWIESDAPFAKRLIAFAIVEGLFFSGSFCSIFWIKKKNLMPGLISSNELIARDEGMHLDFALLLYSMISNRIDEEIVHGMFKDAVEIETEFICESLPCELLGMNSRLMTQYIKFVADRILISLGYNKIWNETNPFTFMENISLQGKTNFFETRPTQYQNPNILNTSRNNSYNLHEDF